MYSVQLQIIIICIVLRFTWYWSISLIRGKCQLSQLKIYTGLFVKTNKPVNIKCVLTGSYGVTVNSHLKALGLYDFVRGFDLACIQGSL